MRKVKSEKSKVKRSNKSFQFSLSILTFAFLLFSFLCRVLILYKFRR